MNDAERRAWLMAYEDEIAEVIQQSRPRCETCTWWDSNPERDAGTCRKIYAMTNGRHPEQDGVVINIDVQTVTGPNFGCVQHEVK